MDAAEEYQLAIWIARHSRKMGGEVGDTGRGSSAASGDVDIIFDLHRPEGNQATTRRVLESTGRYADVTPEKIVLDYDIATGRYTNLGSDDAVAIADAGRFVSAHLTERFGQKESAATMKDLEALGAAASPSLSRTTIQRGIDYLVSTGAVRKLGAGKKGDPFAWELVPSKQHPRELAVGNDS
jgi:hypothetical protein